MVVGILLEFLTRRMIRKLRRRRRIAGDEFQKRDIPEPVERNSGGLLQLIQREDAFAYMQPNC